MELVNKSINQLFDDILIIWPAPVYIFSIIRVIVYINKLIQILIYIYR